MIWRAKWLLPLAILCAFGGAAAGQGLVAFYEFEGDVLDSSGNDQHGTIAGTVSYEPGVAGQAIRFAGAGNGVNLGQMDLPAVTVSLWARFNSNDTGTWIVDQAQLTGGNWYGWNIRNHSSGLLWLLGNGTPTRVSLAAPFTMYDPQNPGRWRHIAATHNGAGAARLYLDGQMVAQSASLAYAAATNYDAFLRRPGQASFDGRIDELMIFNRALDAGEITALYQQGLPLRVLPDAVQTLVALEDSPAPGPVVYTVHNDNPGASKTIDIAEVDANGDVMDYGWLSLSTTQIVGLAPSGNAAVQATIDHTNLAPGSYTAYLRFSDDSTPAKVVTRQLGITVLGCQWTVAPGSVSRNYLHDSGDPVAPVQFTVTNTGKHGLSYTVAEVVDQPWLVLDKSGDGPLDYQSSSVVTATIDVTGLAVGEYTADIRFTNNCNPSDEVVHTVTLHVGDIISLRGLVAYYRFEDTIRDWSPNEYLGTVFGTPGYVEGSSGRAIYLQGEGSGEGVNLGPLPTPASSGPKDMSAVFWYRGDGTQRSGWPVDKMSNVGGYWRGWQVRVGHEWWGLDWQVPLVHFRWCHGGVRDGLNLFNPNRDVAIPNLYDGNWHLIAMTIEDAGNGKVNVRGYFDGALIEGQNIWSQTPDWVRYEVLNTDFEPADVSQSVWVSNVPQDGVRGGVDELSLWNRALSAEEILAMYQARFQLYPPLWPDADADGDVDMDDFAIAQRCHTGAGGTIANPDTCARFDRDFDGDIDNLDMLHFVACATGPGILLDVNDPPVGCKLD